MTQLLYLIVGGVIGTVSRYVCVGGLQGWLGNIFPYGTLAVNMLGSFLIGLALAITEQYSIAPQWRVFLFVGIFGSFTTFSSFTMETMNLIRTGDVKAALLYVVISNVLGLLMVVGGHVLTGWVMK